MKNAVTQHTQRVTGQMRAQAELHQMAFAQAMFAQQMTFARSITHREPRYRRYGQGMCRPGWTGDMWKGK